MNTLKLLFIKIAIFMAFLIIISFKIYGEVSMIPADCLILSNSISPENNSGKILQSFSLISTSLHLFSEESSGETSSPSFIQCNCLLENKRNVDLIIKNAKGFQLWCAKESTSYPYYLRYKELKNCLVQNPIYYYQYHNNLTTYNKTLLLEIEYNMFEVNDLERRVKKPCYDKRIEVEKKRKSIVENGIPYNLDLDNKIQLMFSQKYSTCSKYHNQDANLFDRSFLAYIQGDAINACELAEKYLDTKQNDIQNFSSTELFSFGLTYLDTAQFTKAIDLLSHSLAKDPLNKAAYFYRGTAYFEIGDFDSALQDYMYSNRESEMSKSPILASLEFTNCLIRGLSVGASEAAIDFFPSIFKSAYGIGEGLWITVQQPVATTSNFASLCYEMGNSAYDFCRNLDWEKIDDYAYEFRDFCDNFAELSEAEKGEQLGHIIGKYGIEIFAGSVTCKGINAYKNLKNANRICNLETMSISNANKEAIISEAIQHASNREKFFREVIIQWDKQNKHIPGKHNYEPGKSIFEHKDAQSLVNRFGGSGMPINNEFPGTGNYREIVDFKENIGIWKNKEGTLSLPTTKGTIHYSKNGAHIIPTHPDTVIK